MIDRKSEGKDVKRRIILKWILMNVIQ